MNEFMAVIKNYAGFSGRAGRKEYWMFILVYILIYIALMVVGSMLPESIGMILPGLFGLALLIPTLAVGARRLHDGDRSGWWLLLSIVPIASFYLLYLLIIKGTPGANRFGEPAVALIPGAV